MPLLTVLNFIKKGTWDGAINNDITNLWLKWWNKAVKAYINPILAYLCCGLIQLEENKKNSAVFPELLGDGLVKEKTDVVKTFTKSSYNSRKSMIANVLKKSLRIRLLTLLIILMLTIYVNLM